jgi:hypothetical protein
MANQVKVLLDSFGLFDKVIAYVKDEGSNLGTLTSALTNVVTCSPLQLTIICGIMFWPCHVKGMSI